jgi:hypothetical protein
VESPPKVPPAVAGSAAFKRPTEGALREEGADEESNPPTWVEGTAAARHAVMPPPSPEPYRRGERVRGGRPGGLAASLWRLEGRRLSQGNGIHGRGSSSLWERRPYP